MFSLKFGNSRELVIESELVGLGYLRLFVSGENDSDGKSITGRVISVYSRALNILIVYGGRCLLVSIVRDIEQMSSLSIFVPDLFKFGEKVIKGFVGRYVVMSELSLNLGNVVIGIDKRRVWDGNIKDNSWEFSKTDCISLFLKEGFVEYLVGILSSVAGIRGFVPILTCRVMGKTDVNIERYVEYAIKYLEEVEQRVKKMRGEKIDLSGLVGLGIGFTPSGDDFIAGSLLADSLVSIFIIDRSSIEKRLVSTNYGGRTLLWQAIRDEFPYYLIEGIRKLLNIFQAAGGRDFPREKENREAVERVVGELISHGSTSGIDAFTGFLWYLYLLRLRKRV